MSYTVEKGKSYNFVTQVPQILGTDYTNALVLGNVEYSIASAFSDVTAIHRRIYPFLAPGVARDPALLNYALLSVSGNRKVIALEWLAQQPEEVSTQKITVVVDAVPSRLTALLSALSDNRFNVSSYKFTN